MLYDLRSKIFAVMNLKDVNFILQSKINNFIKKFIYVMSPGKKDAIFCKIELGNPFILKCSTFRIELLSFLFQN